MSDNNATGIGFFLALMAGLLTFGGSSPDHFQAGPTTPPPPRPRPRPPGGGHRPGTDGAGIAFAGAIAFSDAPQLSPIRLVLMRQPEIAVICMFGPDLIEIVLSGHLPDLLEQAGVMESGVTREQVDLFVDAFRALNLEPNEGVLITVTAHHEGVVFATRSGRPSRMIILEGMDRSRADQIAGLGARSAMQARTMPWGEAEAGVTQAIDFIRSGASFGAAPDTSSLLALMPLLMLSSSQR